MDSTEALKIERYSQDSSDEESSDELIKKISQTMYRQTYENEDSKEAVNDLRVSYPLFHGVLMLIGVVPADKTWPMLYRGVYLAYVFVVVFPSMVLTVPYVWYQKQWLDIPPGRVQLFSAVFTMLPCIQPPCAWLFLLLYFRSSHCQKTLLPLMTKLEDSGAIQKFLRLRLWRNFQVVLVVWTTYTVWWNITAVPKWPDIPAVGHRVLLLIVATFGYRLAAPIIACLSFELIVELHEVSMQGWYEQQRGNVCVEASYKLLVHNVNVRNSTEKAFLPCFTMALTMPVIMAVMFLMDLDTNPIHVIQAWFWVPYMAHFMRQACLIFMSAAEVSATSATLRFELLDLIVRRNVIYEGEETQKLAFVQNLIHGYRGFELFGIPITRALGARIVQLSATFVTPLVLRIVSRALDTLHEGDEQVLQVCLEDCRMKCKHS